MNVRLFAKKRRSKSYKDLVRGFLIENGDMFDARYYRARHPNAPANRTDAIAHFVTYGLPDNLSPHPLFDSEWYISQCPEAISECESAFEHYIAFGVGAGRSPHPLFDVGYYRNKYLFDAAANYEPLAHYLRVGAHEGFDPNPFFRTRWYAANHKQVEKSGLNPLLHFVEYGEHENLRPSPLFDVSWYNEQRISNDGGALSHYMMVGRGRGLSPHPFFDLLWYSEVRPDVVASGQSLAEHYLIYGEGEGTRPNPYFDPFWYLSSYSDVALSGLGPLEHFAIFGEQKDRDPGPDFSSTSYLAANPDVVGYGAGALVHYLRYGREEKRALYVDRDPISPSAFVPVPIEWGQPRIMIVDATYPTPDRDSGSIDAVNFVRIFQRLGYKVYFIAVANFKEDDLSAVSRDARAKLEALDVCVLDFRHGPFAAEIIRLNGGYFRMFFLSRFNCGGELYEHIRAHTAMSKIIFNTVDLHSLREERESVIKQDRQGFFESYRTAEREYYLARQADATIVVSDEEARLLESRAPGSNIFTVPLIRDIPGRARPYSSRAGLGFIGGYRHPPNVDAVRYFLDEIWPLIRAELPDVTFRLMGPYLPEEILQRTDPGLEILGFVDDLTELFSKLRLTVAPLRYGAGAKGKVVSSLSHGVPCVVSSIAAEGMGVGEAQAVLIGDTPSEFAAHVVRCYTDAHLWEDLSDKGFKLMEERYSFSAGLMAVDGIMKSITVSEDWSN